MCDPVETALHCLQAKMLEGTRNRQARSRTNLTPCEALLAYKCWRRHVLVQHGFRGAEPCLSVTGCSKDSHRSRQTALCRESGQAASQQVHA